MVGVSEDFGLFPDIIVHLEPGSVGMNAINRGAPCQIGKEVIGRNREIAK